MIAESRLVDHFHEQGKWCAVLGSPFTASLLSAMGHDFEAGGPVSAICGDWEGNPRKDALALRIAGALHHAVLSGTAPALSAVYPQPGKAEFTDHSWQVVRDWLSANSDIVRAYLGSPPQTNEIRRSIALLPGFLELAARFEKPMHLLELGASAGLNQNWDAYAYQTDSWRWGSPSGAIITTDWQGPAPSHLDARPEIAARTACDLTPIDLKDEAAITRLKSYTWPDQFDRLEKLDAAIEIAKERKTRVDQADALDWLKRQLASRQSGALTVVYHSVFLIYPPKDVIAEIMAVIERPARKQRLKTPSPGSVWSQKPCSVGAGTRRSLKFASKPGRAVMSARWQ